MMYEFRDSTYITFVLVTRHGRFGGKKMKSTGIVRKVDELGRIVLPIELRRTLDIAEKDSMEIYIEGDAIIRACRRSRR